MQTPMLQTCILAYPDTLESEVGPRVKSALHTRMCSSDVERQADGSSAAYHGAHPPVFYVNVLYVIAQCYYRLRLSMQRRSGKSLISIHQMWGNVFPCPQHNTMILIH